MKTNPDIKIYIETYGCSANKSESEIMAGILESKGMVIVDSESQADILIINTCVVKEPTETKILYRIKQLNDFGKKLIIAGCMPEIRQREILKVAPNSTLVSTHQLGRILEAVESIVKNEKRYFMGKSNHENICMPRKRFNKLISIIEISKGCLGDCTYCSVRDVKGKLQSYSRKSIIQEIKNSISGGCADIWLTSQDCGCYGKDKGESLVDLLKEIEKIPGDFRLRVGMMNPEHISSQLDGLIECYKNERVYKFLHIPLQSGSDTVLRRMKRRYTTSDFNWIIRKFREKIPEINIWTDLIVGFPGETEGEFESTLKLMKDLRLDAANISKFGAMKDTPAAKMDQVDRKVVNERARKLGEVCRNITIEINNAQIGMKKRILLVEEIKKGTLKGNDESFRQVVTKSSEGKLGDTIECEIVSASLSGLSTL